MEKVDLNKFDLKEVRKSAKEYRDKIDSDRQKSIDFFETKKFFHTLDIIKKWMIENSIFEISSDYFDYHVKLPISNDEFCDVLDSIYNTKKDESKIDYDGIFYVITIQYNEWDHKFLSGQGGETILILHKDRLRDLLIDKIL
jgi:hypothetical protein